MKCKNCGADLGVGAKFCGACGTKVDDVPNIGSDTVNSINEQVVNNINSQPVSSQSFNNEVNSINTNSGVNNVASQVSNGGTNSSKKIIVPIVILLLLACVAGGLFYYFKNPKRIVTSVINGAYDKFEGLVVDSNSFDYEKDSMFIDGKLTFSSNIPELADLNSEDLSYSVGLDYPNKKMSMGVSLYEGSSKLIDAIVYFLNDEGYISLKDDFPSLIKLDSEDTDFSEVFSIEKSSASTEDIKYIVKTYKEILIDSLDMSEFEKSSEKITLNGKEVSVDKLTYTFNEENTKKLSKNIIDRTLADSELLEALARVSNTSVDEIKSDLESVDYDMVTSNNFVISIYTKGFSNSLVGIDVAISEGEDIRFRFNDETTDIDLYSANVRVAGVEVKQLSKDSYSIDFDASFADVSGSIVITNKEIDSKNIEGSVKLTVNYDGSTFSLTNDYTCKLGVDIASIDTSNFKNYNELTDEEMNALSELYSSRFENSKLYGLFESLSSLMSNYDDYDYDYDYDFDYDYDDLEFNSSL